SDRKNRGARRARGTVVTSAAPPRSERRFRSAVIAELETYQDQLLSIRQDAPGLASGLSDAQFNWRPAENRWSMAECFDHLNATARQFIPVIDAAIADGRARTLESTGPFTYPLFERLFLRMTEPPRRLRFRAPKAFRPSPHQSAAAVVSAFLEWQEQIADRLRQADGIDLRKVRQRSP